MSSLSWMVWKFFVIYRGLRHMPNSTNSKVKRAPKSINEMAIARKAADYGFQKRVFDIFVSCALLAVLAPICVGLLILNPVLNRGPLFFFQERMGKDCHRFTTWKFRSMTAHDTEGKDAGTGVRGAFDRLDSHRITALGRFLRKSRVDELPQIINVLRGEMSLVGPRPDAFSHAQTYLDEIPGYRARFAVLPGISGLAQLEVGYVDDRDGVSRKVAADLHYLSAASMWNDLRIAKRTVATVLLCRGN